MLNHGNRKKTYRLGVIILRTRPKLKKRQEPELRTTSPTGDLVVRSNVLNHATGILGR